MDFGWRDAILLLAVIMAVYLVVALLGLARLRQRRPAARDMAAAAGEFPVAVAPPMTSPPEAAPPPAPFADQLALAGLEAELGQLRSEVAALREEVAELKVARRVSPLYETALDLGRRGFDARGVAEECGISVAEAELVLALARDGGDFDRERLDDGSGQRIAAERH